MMSGFVMFCFFFRSEDLVVEKRYCDHCNLPWVIRSPERFEMIRQKNGTIRGGLAITLPNYVNFPTIYKVQPGLNFINVLRTAFTLVDPKSVKRY